jgi:hypothetical protein
MAEKKSRSTTISPRWVRVLRVAWVVLVILAIGLTIFGYNLSYQTKLGTCTGSFCEDLNAAIGSEFQVQDLGTQVGLSPAASEVATIVVEFIAVLPYLVVGYILFSRRSNDRLVWLGAFMLPSFGLSVIATAIDGMTGFSSWIGPAARTILMIGQLTFLVFFYVFPDGRFVPRWTFLIAAYWGLAFLLFVPLEPLGYDPFATELGSILFILTLVGILAVQIYRYRRVSSAVEKQQTKWVVIGLTISLGGFVLSILIGEFLYGDNWPPVFDGIVSLIITFLFALIPIWIGIAIMRYRLWDVEVIINRALIYGLLSAILAGIFAASVVVINSLARELFGEEATTTAGVVSALIVASIFQPLKGGIEKWINTRLYPDNINLNKEFIEFSPEFRSSIRLKDLLRVVVQKMVGLVNAQHASIMLVDRSGSFRRTEAHPSKALATAVLKPDKALRAELQKGKVVSKGNQQGLWVPLYVRRLRAHDVIGVLDIGPRKDKSGFSSDDKRALSNLGAEIGASIYAAQLRERK